MHIAHDARRRLTGVAVATAVALATFGVATAPPASAASLSGPNSALIWQQVTFTVGGTTCQSTCTLSLINVNSSQVLTSVNIGMGATNVPLTFTTPAVPTGMSIAASLDGSIVTTAIPLNVTGVTTTTTISAPNTAKLNSGNNYAINVQSQSPSTYLPTGSVTIRNASNVVVGTLNLSPGASSSQATATGVWTPTIEGTFIFTATFNPAPGTFASTSTSAPDSILVTPSGSNIALTMPPQVYLGTPTLLTATVFPTTTTGSAAFTVNSKPISASIPLVNGVATFLWTPTALGQTVVGANFTANGGQTGATQNTVTVIQPTQADFITLTQPGFGTWAPNGTYPLGNGTSFTFQASTLSGAAVTLKNTGACSTPGLTLTISTGSGQCTVVASSVGGNGYGPVNQSYIVTQVPGQQTATLAAPASGKFNVGKTLTLQKANQGTTNAGQKITWKITSGKDTVCSLSYPSDGTVKLKIKKKGTCNVKATAPAVTNQWAKYTLQRTYTGK